MNKLSSQDRSALIRLASSLPAGNPNRKAILAGLKTASSVMTDPKKIAQAIINDRWIDGGGGAGSGAPAPDSKYRGRLERVVKNLIAEGFIFDPDTEEWGTIIFPADDEAEDLFRPYKSGPKFNEIMELMFDEGF